MPLHNRAERGCKRFLIAVALTALLSSDACSASPLLAGAHMAPLGSHEEPIAVKDNTPAHREFKPWELWHIVWRVPDSFETGYHANRSIDYTKFSGCCDRVIALSISSVLLHYPEATIWLWTNNANMNDLLLRKSLIDSDRLFCKIFDPVAEFGSLTQILDVYRKSEASRTKLKSIIWSDLVRLAVLRNYGGSYFDADIALLERVETAISRRGGAPERIRRIFNLVPHRPRDITYTLPCDLFLLEKVPSRRNATCMLANTVLLNFEPHAFVLNEMLLQINKTIGNLNVIKYNAFFLTGFVRKLWLQGHEDVGVISNFYVIAGPRASYEPMDNLLGARSAAPSLHLELESGEARNRSFVHFSLCRNIYALKITSPPAEPCDIFHFDPTPSTASRAERSPTIQPSPDVGLDKSASFVVMILTRRGAFETREAIRQTWARGHRNCVFLVGNRDCDLPGRNRVNSDCVANSLEVIPAERESLLLTNRLIAERLREETATHSDVVELDMVDVYRTLARKIKLGYRWGLEHFPQARWFVKLDDDGFGRLGALRTYLGDFTPHRTVIGCIRCCPPVRREGKWAEFKYKPKSYPTFPVGGCGHVISRDLARYVVETDGEEYQGEDVSLGIWLDRPSIRREVKWVHTPRFDIKGHCTNSTFLLVGNAVSPSKMRTCMVTLP